MGQNKKYTDIQMEYMVSNYVHWVKDVCSSPISEVEWLVRMLLDSKHHDTIMDSLEDHEEPIGYRICSVTGERIEQGYCLFDGDAYYKNEADLIDELRNYERELGIEGKTVSDEELANLAYDKGMYYWTGWHEELE